MSNLNAKLDYYRYKMEKYKVKMNECNQDGGANVGIKLIAFNSSDFPELEGIDRKKFWQTKKIADKIGNKGYIIEMNKNVASIFGSTFDDAEKMANKAAFMSTSIPFKEVIRSQFKENIAKQIISLVDDPNSFKKMQPITLKNTLNIQNHQEVFNELKEIAPITLNKYIIVNFKFGDNIRML